jgi:hypothetical protein
MNDKPIAEDGRKARFQIGTVQLPVLVYFFQLSRNHVNPQSRWP